MTFAACSQSRCSAYSASAAKRWSACFRAPRFNRAFDGLSFAGAQPARRLARSQTRRISMAAPDPAPVAQPAPFFILGCVRSGTTMLRDVLRGHPNLACPEETHFFRWASPFGTPEYMKSLDAPVLRKHREMDGITEAEFKAILKAA